MGQFLQDGENGPHPSFFLEIGAFVWPRDFDDFFRFVLTKYDFLMLKK